MRRENEFLLNKREGWFLFPMIFSWMQQQHVNAPNFDRYLAPLHANRIIKFVIFRKNFAKDMLLPSIQHHACCFASSFPNQRRDKAIYLTKNKVGANQPPFSSPYTQCYRVVNLRHFEKGIFWEFNDFKPKNRHFL